MGNPLSILIISSYVNHIFAVYVDYTRDKKHQNRQDRRQHNFFLKKNKIN